MAAPSPQRWGTSPATRAWFSSVFEEADPGTARAWPADRQGRRHAGHRAHRQGLADLLRTIGPLTAEEVAARCAVPEAAASWLAELARARRARQVAVGGQARWAAIEDARRLRDALGVPLPPGIPEASTEPVPPADLVARYARTHAPCGTDVVASRTPGRGGGGGT